MCARGGQRSTPRIFLTFYLILRPQPNEPAAHRLGWTGGAAKLRAQRASASPVQAGVTWMDRTLRFTVQRLYMKPLESSPQIIRVIPCGRDGFARQLKGSCRHLSLTQQRCSCLGVLNCEAQTLRTLTVVQGRAMYRATGTCGSLQSTPTRITTWKYNQGKHLPLSSLMTGFISCSSLTELETKTNVTVARKRQSELLSKSERAKTAYLPGN